ncbi:MAG: phosphoribosylformylglycinamidine cyclo-ligase [Candidatus Omnitrophica bacterium]|nr:phosphoribosylformylglycinamidine cyclo-ligase [Candidatus Omnitrophota bacterium]
MIRNKAMTYKQAGVDIEQANLFVGDISRLVRSTFSPHVLTGLGGFGGCFSLEKLRYRKPVLVSSADGVGTKIKVAMIAGKHNTVGIDLVAMNVNDILAMGARPLFFLDYISTGKVDRQKLVSIIDGIVAGCRQAGCALIGGETAEMPAIYKKDEYDLAGFCVGIVEKDEIINGKNVKDKDLIVGIESNGLHSNGFSLVHRLFSTGEIKKLSRELLKPTRIYAEPILALLKYTDLKGIAHITGGAFYEKLMRIFPPQYGAEINKGSWSVPEIFQKIRDKGGIQEKEMFRTFNMGIGMAVVVNRTQANKVIQYLRRRHRLRAWVIGKAVKLKKNSPRLKMID